MKKTSSGASSFFFLYFLLNIVIQHVVLTEREHLAEPTCSSLRAEGREGDDGEDAADESQLQRGADATLGPRQNLLQDQRLQSLQANGESWCTGQATSQYDPGLPANHDASVLPLLLLLLLQGIDETSSKDK